VHGHWGHFSHWGPPIIPSAAGGPNWAEIVTAIATAILAVGAAAALFQLREAKRTRHTEAAARMSSRWEAEPYVEARTIIDGFVDDKALRDFLLGAMATRSPARHPLLRELSFLEELGAMEKLGAISLRWVDETMRSLVVARWKLWEATVLELRRDIPAEQWPYKSFELLAKQLQGEALNRRQRLSRWLCRQLTY
jgi:hypothetical protein